MARRIYHIDVEPRPGAQLFTLFSYEAGRPREWEIWVRNDWEIDINELLDDHERAARTLAPGDDPLPEAGD